MQKWAGTRREGNEITILQTMKGLLEHARGRSTRQLTLSQLVEFLNLEGTPKGKLSEATYFACLKILSESMGKLPLKLLKSTEEKGVQSQHKHPLYRVLRYRPNPYMTSTTFWSTVEYNRNHHGNAYCLITGGGTSTQLWILDSPSMQVWYDDACLLSETGGIWYIYSHKGKRYKFSSEEILHFRTSTSFDGVKGLAVGDILTTSLEGSQKAQQMLNKMYESGFTAKAVLQYTGSLNDELVKKYVQGIEDYAGGKDDLVKNIIPIPAGSTLQPLNVKLADAEFLGLKKYSALQIAAAFGIKPNQINDYEKSSYASAEAQQLAFYVDTLLYTIKQYEEEISYKLLTDQEQAEGLHFKFNVSVILRADLKTQIETLTKAVGGFLYTPNEARALLDKGALPGGDRLIGNGAYIPLEMIGEQYKKGGEADAA